MPSTNPQLYAVVTESKTVLGAFSLRAVKDGRQVPVQTVMEDAGFVPDDLVVLILKSEYDKLKLLASSARAYNLDRGRPGVD